MLRTPFRSTTAAADRMTVGQVTKTCGHAAHVGTCSSCQRAQLAKWRMQLAQVAR